MQIIDWVVLLLYFLLLICIGVFAYRKVKNSNDFYVGGGKIPWWLAGVSHHVTGYSGAVFVAYAALAYTHGFCLYVWWAFTIAIGITAGAFFMAPRWSKLRSKINIQSPTGYLATRYNIQTQQLIAWYGIIIKLFDVGAKWAAIAVILNGFTGIPIITCVLISGCVSLMYITVGGIWADVMNDFTQFIVQFIAGTTMLVFVLIKLGGIHALWETWYKLPAEHHQLFNTPYTFWFALAFLFINFLSYNGGTWNLAMKYIATPSGKDAKKSALLSASLYLIWPIVLFIPMWFAPVIIPDLIDTKQSYTTMVKLLLPPGLIGLVLAGMFSNTMAMASSDSNTISSVITRDVLPTILKRIKNLDPKKTLILARATTFTFTFMTLMVAINNERFGGILGLIISWFGALVGPAAIPMLLGMLPPFRRCGPASAIIAIIGGIIAFIFTKYPVEQTLAVQLATPIGTAFVLYVIVGFFSKKEVKPEVNEIINAIRS